MKKIEEERNKFQKSLNIIVVVKKKLKKVEEENKQMYTKVVKAKEEYSLLQNKEITTGRSWRPSYKYNKQTRII